MKEETIFQIGDRVKRRPVNNFKHMADEVGTIVEITYGNRNKIKWDRKNSTGQQHSTIKSKFLEKATSQVHHPFTANK